MTESFEVPDAATDLRIVLRSLDKLGFSSRSQIATWLTSWQHDAR